ncbi:MAG: ribonucleoside-diphosphate reductase subunit alpha [Candidatus Omnitrophica bacterium]|nr:ribonucleoside-diphosphate reductase subunit alpha [Candidatus Omnitrophota bacterium]
MSQKTVSNSDIKIQKRNGQIIEFIPQRIVHAIANSFKEQYGLPRESGLSQELANHVQKVADCVMAVLRERGTHRPFLTVEEIQDEVIRQLYENSHKEIAERYASYRRHHAERRKLFDLYSVIKRDGKVVSFKQEKISSAIAHAMIAQNKNVYNEILVEKAHELSGKVVLEITKRWPDGKSVHIEEVQDIVERVIMDAGFHDVARRYIIYREERAKARRNRGHAFKDFSMENVRNLNVKDESGGEKPIDLDQVRFQFEICCRGLSDVSLDKLFYEVIKHYFNGMTQLQLVQANIMAARSLIEQEPNYGFVAARLLLLREYREALGKDVSFEVMETMYPEYFAAFIQKGLEHGLLDPALKQFDLKLLGQAIVPQRDFLFRSVGLTILYDRYFMRLEETRIELPQIFWMRVSMGLAVQGGSAKNQKAVEYYNMLSTFRFMVSTATLLNSGTCHAQLSSCFVVTIEDDLQHIFKCISDDALFFRWSGGLANDWSNIRALGSPIRGTGVRARGVIPFLKVANDAALAVSQGPQSHGAITAYLEIWHLDVEEFIQLRKNTGDERRRTPQMHTALWIPDLFMKRVKANSQWTLFSPSDTPDLHHIYGRAFEKRYEEYEQKAQDGKIENFKTISAVQLWRKMLGMVYETGHPWLTWKDPSNVRSCQDHVGVVHSANLCAGVLLNTSKDETAVCHLGSVNLGAHVSEKGIDVSKLKETVTIAVDMLDQSIDINFYPTVESKAANQRHRPIGLGITGFQDALYSLNLSYASKGAVDFADESTEMVSYYAYSASVELARLRGTYPSYKGSKWERGLLPIDTIELLEQERGGYLSMDKQQRLDWASLRADIKQNGLRNSLIMAVTGGEGIASIIGTTACVEPAYKNVSVKTGTLGEFSVINESLVKDLKKSGLWDQEMINDLKYFDGSVQEMTRVPAALKAKYATSFEIDYEWIIEAASRRQKWIDMGESFSLYQAKPSTKKMSEMYFYAWEKGLKTTHCFYSREGENYRKHS